jgi:hypothetical protein
MVGGCGSGARALLKRARKGGGVLTETAAFEACPQLRGWLSETFARPMESAAAGAPGGVTLAVSSAGRHRQGMTGGQTVVHGHVDAPIPRLTLTPLAP